MLPFYNITAKFQDGARLGYTNRFMYLWTVGDELLQGGNRVAKTL